MAGSEYGDDATISGSVVINDGSSSESDFRIESDSQTHMLFVDAGNDYIGINNDTPATLLHVVSPTSPHLDPNDATDATLLLQTSAASVGRSTSLTCTSDGTNVGAAMVYITRGDYSQGDLAIQAKRSTANEGEPETRLLISGSKSTYVARFTALSASATDPCLNLHIGSDNTTAAGFGTYVGYSAEADDGADVPMGGANWFFTYNRGASNYISGLGWATAYNGTGKKQMMLLGNGLYVNDMSAGDLNPATDSNGNGLTVKIGGGSSDSTSRYAGSFTANYDHTNAMGLFVRCGDNAAAGTNTALMIEDGDGTIQGRITFTGGTTTYSAFTGVHEVAVQASDFTASFDAYDYGSLVKIISTTSPTEKKINYVVVRTTSAQDKAVMGVYSAHAPFSEDLSENNHQVFALGDGHVLVCSEGGDIALGDYICSSNTQGHGMKQDEDLLYNYTVAKATEAVSWANESSNTKLISCTYHSA